MFGATEILTKLVSNQHDLENRIEDLENRLDNQEKDIKDSDKSPIPDWFPEERYFRLSNGNIGIPWEYRSPKPGEWYVIISRDESQWNRGKDDQFDKATKSSLDHSRSKVILKECRPIKEDSSKPGRFSNGENR